MLSHGMLVWKLKKNTQYYQLLKGVFKFNRHHQFNATCLSMQKLQFLFLHKTTMHVIKPKTTATRIIFSICKWSKFQPLVTYVCLTVSDPQNFAAILAWLSIDPIFDSWNYHVGQCRNVNRLKQMNIHFLLLKLWNERKHSILISKFESVKWKKTFHSNL